MKISYTCNIYLFFCTADDYLPLKAYKTRILHNSYKVSNLVSQLTSPAESKMALNIHIPEKKEYRISKE